MEREVLLLQERIMQGWAPPIITFYILPAGECTGGGVARDVCTGGQTE